MKYNSKKEFNNFITYNWFRHYKDNKSNAAYDNLMLTANISVVFIAIMLALTLAAFIIQDTHLVGVYLTMIPIVAVLFMIAVYLIRKCDYDGVKANFLIYGLSFVIIYFSVYIVFAVERSANMISFFIMIVLLPVIIVDIPYRKLFFQTGWGAIFITALLNSEFPQDFKAEYIVNCIVITACAHLIGCHMSWRKIEAYDNARILEYLNTHDSVTQLLNRRSIFDDLEAEAEDRILQGILIFDIDDFKQINDTYGHRFGDKCIKFVANVLADYGEKNHIKFYRYGGDEFVGIYDVYCELGITQIAQDIKELVASVPLTNDKDNPVHLSISAGYSLVDESMDYETFIILADRAMYVDKQMKKSLLNKQKEKDVC